MSAERRAIALMAALTFTTGIADAVGFLGLDRIFVGNMTGNVIVLGMGVAGGDDLPVLGPVFALVAFTCGAAAAGFTLRGSSERWNTRTTVLLATGGLVLACAAVAMFFVDTDNRSVQFTIAAASALAMGEQAAVARAVAVRDMTTVVVTSTLTSFASESLTDPNAESWLTRVANRRVGAIVAIFVGALVGALLLLVHPGLALLTAAAVTSTVAVVGHRYSRQLESGAQ